MLRAIKRFIFKTGYQYLLKPVFFKIDPEVMHDLFTRLGRFLGQYQLTKTLTRYTFHYQHPSLEQHLLGLTFPNPIGLSAGFDKDANLTGILNEVGFGFMQVGTITRQPYEGNPKPRLFRLPKSRGLVVNYGLKNIGCKRVIKKLLWSPSPHFIKGISIGKTNSQETAGLKAGIQDYQQCLHQVIEAGVGDFYTINISCPNTFGGEPYTTPKRLAALLQQLYTLAIDKPVLLKMPINLPWHRFKGLLAVALSYKIDGVIIGNLNKDRHSPLIKEPIPQSIKGSVSGLPTKHLSNSLISQTYQAYGKKLTIIGVGGVFSAEDAYEKIRRGASLVQLITGMIYQGPQLIGEINQRLVQRLHQDSYRSISEAVGAFHR